MHRCSPFHDIYIYKDTKSSIKVLLSMGDEAARLLQTMSSSKIGHCSSQRDPRRAMACSQCCGFVKNGTRLAMQWDRCVWKPGVRTVSGSVKYFIEMLMEAEAHQQPSLSSGIAAAADFLAKLDGEDWKTPKDSCAGEVFPSSFCNYNSRLLMLLLTLCICLFYTL